MTRPDRVALTFLLGAALFACAGPSRISQDLLSPDPRLRCGLERGMGGTGITDGERGMGGTGLMAASDERGMGGTGISAGIIGTITGFGSICVSGVRVAYDETTAITGSNLPAALDALARGMTVAAVVSAQGGELKASRIEILHALVGPVTSTAPFAVMGASVNASHAARESSASFAVGDVVVVDGLQRPDGAIDATRIARAASGASASVRGSVSSSSGTIRVAGVPLAPTPGAFQPGAWVVVAGDWTGDRLTPTSLSAAPELYLPADTRLSLEGYLIARPGGGFGIRGIPVRENLERQLASDVIARLAAGQRVQIIGAADADGAVRPQTIVVPDFNSPLRSELPSAAPANTASEAAPEAGTEDIARLRAAAAAAAAATAATQTREALQLQRGVYGTTVTRPEALRSLTPVVPDAIRTRPLQTRPNVPTRPEAPPQRPNRGG